MVKKGSRFSETLSFWAISLIKQNDEYWLRYGLSIAGSAERVYEVA